MIFKKLIKFSIYIFALVGIIFSGVYLGMQTGIFNVKGSAKERNTYFTNNISIPKNRQEKTDINILCDINIIHKYAPVTSVNIYLALLDDTNISIIKKMIFTAKEEIKKTNVMFFEEPICDMSQNISSEILPKNAYAWADSNEWRVMKEAFSRDQDIIRKAARDAGISPRLILSGVIGEQFRFFGNSRESFKQYFEPLKILASLSKTSFGIAGLKPYTVIQIEDNLKNKDSVFYLGDNMEDIVDYKNIDKNDIEKKRMERITDTKNPYYSYLYVGLYMRQIISQWDRVGYDISNRPDVLSTLYNLGFPRSIPKPNPISGGANIQVQNRNYTFGDLGYEFYYSGELIDIFPFDENFIK